MTLRPVRALRNHMLADERQIFHPRRGHTKVFNSAQSVKLSHLIDSDYFNRHIVKHAVRYPCCEGSGSPTFGPSPSFTAREKCLFCPATFERAAAGNVNWSNGKRAILILLWPRNMRQLPEVGVYFPSFKQILQNCQLPRIWNLRTKCAMILSTALWATIPVLLPIINIKSVQQEALQDVWMQVNCTCTFIICNAGQ